MKIFKTLFPKKNSITISFYRETYRLSEYRWYADLPGVPKEDCEMIEGSDTYLEHLRTHPYLWNHNHNRDRITLDIYTRKPKKCLAHFVYKDKDIEGYSYTLKRESGTNTRLNDRLLFSLDTDSFSIWVCKCLDLLYKDTPTDIYVAGSHKSATCMPESTISI